MSTGSNADDISEHNAVIEIMVDTTLAMMLMMLMLVLAAASFFFVSGRGRCVT